MQPVHSQEIVKGHEGASILPKALRHPEKLGIEGRDEQIILMFYLAARRCLPNVV